MQSPSGASEKIVVPHFRQTLITLAIGLHEFHEFSTELITGGLLRRREATIFSKHGSPRSGSQNGSSFNSP